MTTATTKYLTAVDTAKLLRAALKDAFPGVKFSVRAADVAINVRWVDGPVPAAVSAITNQFRGADFNGYDDSLSPRPATMVGGVPVQFGAHFVFTHRYLSPEFRSALVAQASAIVGGELDEARWYDGNYRTPFGVWFDARGESLVRFLADHTAA